MPQFWGIIPALITPFNHNGEVYAQGVENEVAYLHANGMRNIFILGSYGSFPVMTTEERMKMADLTLKSAKARNMKVIVQIGSPSTEIAVQLARHAESLGVDAISAVVPFYYSSTIYSETDILRYYETIVNAVSVPVHNYNNANTTGFNVSPAFLGKLIDIGLRGIKDSGSEMERILNMIKVVQNKGVDFDYYPASTSSLITGFLLGAQSCISGVSLSVPSLVNAIYEGMMKGDTADAIRLYERVMEVRSLLGKHGGRAIAAYDVFHARGIDIGTCKPPWQRLSRENADWLINGLKKLGVF